MTKNKKYLYTITPVGKQYKDSAYVHLTDLYILNYITLINNNQFAQ